MATPTIPQTESDLLALLPPTNISGAIPRDLLPPGEKVLFETRPSFLNLYWGRVIFLGLYLLLWIGLGIASPVAAPGGAILAFPAALYLLYLYLHWRNSAYGMTDQRVLRIGGIRGSEFEDANYSQVHNLAIEGGGIRFDTSPPVGPGYPAVRNRVIRWAGISEVPRVYAFVQQAFAYGLRKMQVAAVTQQKIDQIESITIPCQYCGSPIDLAKLDPANARCPVCTAPLVLPT